MDFYYAKTNKKKYIFIKEHMINKYSIYVLLFLSLIMLINFTIVLYYIFKSKKKEKFNPGTVESAMDFHNIIQKLKSDKLSDFINDGSNYNDNILPPAEEITYIKSYIAAPTTEQLACPAQQEPEVFPPILFIRQDCDSTGSCSSTISLPSNYDESFEFNQEYILGKYPQDDLDWLEKYRNAIRASITENPIVIEIPVVKGDPGIDGRTPQCEKGPPGSPGENIYDTCLQGVKGDDGPQGPRGDKGPSGNDCICEPGLPGPRGLDGIPGQPGISHGGPGTSCVCKPGSPGLPGDAGMNGINGKNCRFIHELDSYLPKHIYESTTGFASAPYIKMDTGTNINSFIGQIPTPSDYNFIYFDLVSKTYKDNIDTPDNNYIVFITNKV